jgi:hypothetical protein
MLPEDKPIYRKKRSQPRMDALAIYLRSVEPKYPFKGCFTCDYRSEEMFLEGKLKPSPMF